MKSGFGIIFKRLRTEKEMTQTELAAKMNTSISVISMLEQNKRVPTLEMLETYAGIFDTDIFEIIREFYVLTGKPLKLKEEKALYQVTSQADIKILNAIKSNRHIYDRMLKNPDIVVELLNDTVLAIEKYNKNKY